MTTFNILDEKDIKNIIARYFSVKDNNVHLEIYPIIEGYGRDEVEIQKVQIKVEIPRGE